MMVLGIDIGSRSIEVVAMRQGEVVEKRHGPTTFNPVQQINHLLEGLEAQMVVATGYGRNLVQELSLGFPVQTITEIKAHGLGAHHLFPKGRTVLDIGGQDTKALSLLPGGRVGKFEMNDRCAAGTGKFLEYSAQIFQIPIQDFGAYALGGDNPPIINSMCTVFAETEATSLMAQGVKPENIALGLHLAIARRTVNMLNRVGLVLPLIFVGGVAHNPCMCNLLAEQTRTKIDETLFVPKEPDMSGALGAALWAQEIVAETT